VSINAIRCARLGDLYRSFLPDLAGSLSNLGNRLSALGRHEEALAANQEAVDIHRRLAQTRPDTIPANAEESMSIGSSGG